MLETDGAQAERGGWRGTLQIVVIVIGVLVAIWFARAPQEQAHPDDLSPAEPGIPTVTVIRPAPERQDQRPAGCVHQEIQNHIFGDVLRRRVMGQIRYRF